MKLLTLFVSVFSAVSASSRTNESLLSKQLSELSVKSESEADGSASSSKGRMTPMSPMIPIARTASNSFHDENLSSSLHRDGMRIFSPKHSFKSPIAQDNFDEYLRRYKTTSESKAVSETVSDDKKVASDTDDSVDSVSESSEDLMFEMDDNEEADALKQVNNLKDSSKKSGKRK